MPPKQRMRIASKSHSQNVNLRGNVPKSQNPKEEKYPVSKWLIYFFIFVVIGSGISMRGESSLSHPTLGPWFGPQSAPPSQRPSTAKPKRDEKLSGSALHRKRQASESQNRVYTFKHLPNWEEHVDYYKELHLVSSKTSPFETRYVGLPQTFISLPHPEIIRTQTRYVEDRSKYPIPVTFDRSSAHYKASSTPNLCILPGEGSIQLPPLGQKASSIRQDKKFSSSKNLLYTESSQYQRTNYFVDSTLQALSTSLDVLKFDPPSDPRLKTYYDNEMRNGLVKPFAVRKPTSKKLEKLLVTCQNDSLNLENMIQSLCKSIPSADDRGRSTDKTERMAYRGNILNSPATTKQNPSKPSTDQVNNSLLDQFSYEVNKVDYDSPLDLQFDGRIYHTNLETFLQCLDTKLQSYSKASIEELMSSIHIHSVMPPTTTLQSSAPILNAGSSAANKREVKSKIVKGDENPMSCKKFPVNLSLRKGNK